MNSPDTDSPDAGRRTITDIPQGWPIKAIRPPHIPEGAFRYTPGSGYDPDGSYVYVLWSEPACAVQYVGRTASLHRRYELQDLRHRNHVSVQEATTGRDEAAIIESDMTGQTWTHLFAVPVEGVDVCEAELAFQHLYRPVRQGRTLDRPVTQRDQEVLRVFGVEAETGWQDWPLWA
jgi:hypothetical protein